MKTKTKIILFAILLLVIGVMVACEDCLIDDPPVVIIPQTPQELLMQNPWKVFNSYWRDIGTTPWIAILDTFMDTYVFNKTRYSKYNKEGKLIGDGIYILKPDSLILGPNPQGGDGIRYKITINKDTMNLVSRVKYYTGTGVRLPSKDVEKLLTLIH